MRGLPREYGHEPRLALASGLDGLDSVATILRRAHRFLRPQGLLVVEVGNTERILATRISEACRSPGSTSSAVAAVCSC